MVRLFVRSGHVAYCLDKDVEIRIFVSKKFVWKIDILKKAISMTHIVRVCYVSEKVNEKKTKTHTKNPICVMLVWTKMISITKDVDWVMQHKQI